MTVSDCEPDRPPIEIVEFEGRAPVDHKRIKKFYQAIRDDKIHSTTCRCPSCLYQLYKKKGGRFDKESFFLDWLEAEIRLSRIETIEKTIFDSAYRRGEKARSFIDGRDYFKARRGSVRALAEYVKYNLPEINSDYRRIKLKLWRFRKSGILQELEKEISAHELELNQKSWKEGFQGFRVAQRIADFVYSQKQHRADQRKIRRLIQIPVEKIEELRPFLLSNYRIECRLGKRKNQFIYIGTVTDGQGRFMRYGMAPNRKPPRP